MIITVIGAGLAGVEAAHTLSKNGVKVRLCEMKPTQYSPAHTHAGFAELVCSNSLKADRLSTSAGLLKAEMRALGSLTLEVAELTKIAAGGALAVDRTAFSDEITRRLHADPNIEVITGEITDFPESNAIIATGPLTSDTFAEAIKQKLALMVGKPCEAGFGAELLGFYDAAAPIVTAESIDMEKAFMASRYGKGDADYINCPFTQEEYEVFYNELINAKPAELHEIDKVYEACLPVEVLAKRGKDSIRFGCMKPVGLIDPRTDRKNYAVVQLRQENTDKSMYNIVGFQTNLKFGEQQRVFRLIPGLENAEFVRYGVMHRNTFIDSPRLLDSCFRLRGSDNIYFAGQITGVEGYMESAASGILTGLAMAGRLPELPKTTMLGALTRYISTPNENFQPMGANMGLLPPLDLKIGGAPRSSRPTKLKKQEKYERLAERALSFYENSN